MSGLVVIAGALNCYQCIPEFSTRPKDERTTDNATNINNLKPLSSSTHTFRIPEFISLRLPACAFAVRLVDVSELKNSYSLMPVQKMAMWYMSIGSQIDKL